MSSNDNFDDDTIDNEFAEMTLAEEAVHAAGAGTWMLELETGEITCSSRAAELLGCDRRQEPRSFLDLRSFIVPEDWAQFREIILTGQETKQSDAFELVLRTSHQERKSENWIQIRGSWQRDGTGRAIRALGLMIDFNQARRREQELRQAKATADAANAAKSTFLANMSHEIRTPLGAILGFAELMAENNLPADERREYDEIIARNGRQLVALIDDILDLSKVEAGKLEIDEVPIETRTLFEDIFTALRPRAANRDVALTLNFSPTVPMIVKTDPVRLRQITTNLITNALKHTPQGRVVVDVEGIAADSGNLRLQIRVTDNGAGISEEGRARLFEPFVRVDHPGGRGCGPLGGNLGGTGLGLALSRRLARLLGGDVILVSSDVGKGSEFMAWIETHRSNLTLDQIPPAELAVVSEPKHRSVSRPGEDELSGLKILIAEDSPDSQTLLCRLLIRRGAQVSVASDGEEALQRALVENFDLILMDIQMPKVDGYTATRRLREARFSAPVIALTAHAMKEERDRCFAAGCDDHLAKPVSPQLLIHTIAKHIVRH
jgi:hypothetical protein